MINREDYYCPLTKKQCRKWQKDRGMCFYNIKNSLKNKLYIFLHGECSHYQKWEMSE